MFKNYFKGIDGIAGYPILLLVVFILFFLGILIYLWKADKYFFKKMSEMPLSDDSLDSTTTNSKKTFGL